MTDKFEVVGLPVDEIRRRPDARSLNDAVVADLADSIEKVGLISPIRVRRVGTHYELVAGSHRYTACDSLGFRTIPCIVVEADDLHAELAMIDENLCRAELLPVDRAKQTARRKAIYEALHPETKHGQNLENIPSGQFVHTGKPSFAAETAKTTGRDERSVRRDAERGEKVADEAVDLIRGTRLDRGAYLDRIKHLPTQEQVDTVKRDLAAPAVPRGGIAARYASASSAPNLAGPAPSFEEVRSAIELLYRLKPDDYLKLCPPNKRAALCQRLERIAETFQQITEGVTV
jgi:uncharacterized ParB-like nuclease family protein